MPRSAKPPSSVSLATGIHQETDELSAAPAALNICNNARVTKGGAVVQRPGVISIPGTVSTETYELTADEKIGFIGSLGGAGVIGSRGSLLAYDPDRLTLDYQGRYSTAIPIKRRYGLTSEMNSGMGRDGSAAISIAGEYMLVASSDGASVHWFIEHLETGARPVYGRKTGRRCLVLKTAGSWLLVYSNNAGEIHVCAINFTTFVVNGDSTVFTLPSATYYWDATASGTDDFWFLAANNEVGAAESMWVTKFEFDTVISQIDAGLTTAAEPWPISIWTAGNWVWIGRVRDPSATGQAQIIRYTYSLASPQTTNIESVAGGLGCPLIGPSFPTLLSNPDDNIFFVYQKIAQSLGSQYTGFGRINGSAPTTLLDHDTVENMCPVSKPDRYQSYWALTGSGVPSDELTRHVLVRAINHVTTDLEQNLELAGPLNGPVIDNFAIEKIRAVSAEGPDGHMYFAALTYLRSEETDSLRRMDIYEYCFSDVEPKRTLATVGNSIVVSGQPTQFYGRSFAQYVDPTGTFNDPRPQGGVEIGFAPIPAIRGCIENGAGSVSPGSYQYAMTWEWIDQYGDRHLSSPSAPSAVTVASPNSAVDVYYTSLPHILTQRSNQDTAIYPVVHIYRTEANGEIFHRVTPATGAPVANQDGVYNDTMSDSDLIDNEPGYWQSASPYTLAPSARYIVAAEDRIWFGGLWEANIIQGSRVKVPGEPYVCSDNDAHKVLIPEDVTAMEYLDGSMVVWGANGCYLVTGAGPDERDQGTFDPPRLISNVGAVLDSPVVKSSLGLYFQSRLGIHLLPRGFGQPIFVGAPVRDFLATYPIILDAAGCSTPDGDEVRWVISNGSATKILIYSEVHQIWTTDDVKDFDVSQSIIPIQAIGVWPEGYCYALEDASDNYPIRIENLNITKRPYDLQGVTQQVFPINLETVWFPVFGHATEGRLQSVTVSGYAASAGTTTITVYTDGSGTPQVQESFTETAGSFFQDTVVLEQPRAIMALVTIRFTPSNGSTAYGTKFSGITFESEARMGIRRARSGRQRG